MKSWGKNKIRQHLKQKQISEKLISSCMDEIDPEDYRKTLEKIYAQYYEKQKGLKEYAKRVKTIRYLLTRGFEYELISEISSAE